MQAETHALATTKLPYSPVASRTSTATHGSRPWQSPRLHREVDWLEVELQASEGRLFNEEVNRHRLEDQRLRLIHEVVGLEAAKRSSQRNAQHWQTRANELEMKVASQALSLDGTSVALTEAQAREKAAAQRAINGWLAEAEAKNAILSVTAQARDQQLVVQKLEAQLLTERRELVATRNEAALLRVDNDRLQTRHDECQNANAKLRAEYEAQYEALCDGNRRMAIMQGQIERLERNVQAGMDKELELEDKLKIVENENERLRKANNQLRLDMQEMVSQATTAAEVPFYSNAAWGTTYAHSIAYPPPPVEPQTARLSGSQVLSPRSRRQYPRSAHVAAKKAEILEARKQALDKIDSLREFPVP